MLIQSSGFPDKHRHSSHALLLVDSATALLTQINGLTGVRSVGEQAIESSYSLERNACYLASYE
jgi:hypothetical protein